MKPPLSPSFVTAGIPRFRDVFFDDASPYAYWLEQRPDDEGRTSLFRAPLDGSGTPVRVSPAGFDVRSRVHEYGGGAAWIDRGLVVTSSGIDGRLHAFRPEGPARPLTPPGPWRFADFRVDPKAPRVYAVVETATGNTFPSNTLGAVPLGGGAPRTLAAAADFYASPRPSADGRRLAWVQWRHPDLPWTSSEVVVADVDDDGALVRSRRLAGGGGESVVDPTWHPDGSLWFASDRSGRWNLCRADVSTGVVTALPSLRGEQALPHWVFGRPLFGFDGDGGVFSAAVVEGRTSAWRLDGSHWTPWLRDDGLGALEPVRIFGDRALAIATGPHRAASVVTLDTRSGRLRPLRTASADPRELVDYDAEAVALPRRDGGTVHAFVYRPRDAARPPGIVSVHGGPTAQASFAPDATVLFWLSQGFSWIDVNYGGSTGYGRDFQDRLRHRWGEIDVDDCVDAARALRASGSVGPLAIRGNSAGGFTALRAAMEPGMFFAVTAAYGVTDLALLFADTHKFEAHYGEWLLGPGDWTALSPARNPERIEAPVLFLQGLDDKVVPPSQSEAMYRALVGRGLPAEYVTFAGEGHGFRRAETIEKALATELAFYRKHLPPT